jgi:hypothetical protein
MLARPTLNGIQALHFRALAATAKLLYWLGFNDKQFWHQLWRSGPRLFTPPPVDL